MSKSRTIAEEVKKRHGATTLSVGLIQLPNYESGPLSTHHLAEHLSHMIENWEKMDGETFTRANGTARSATKFWDTIRGLERNTIEREKLAIKMGTGTLQPARK